MNIPFEHIRHLPILTNHGRLFTKKSSSWAIPVQVLVNRQLAPFVLHSGPILAQNGSFISCLARVSLLYYCYSIVAPANSHTHRPNLVTLIGFSFVVFNFLTVLYYNPSLSSQTPPWTYISYAIGLFLYQAFDACDGLQARRTSQSSPLGELFDHCVDACNTTLAILVFASATNLGTGYPLLIAQCAALTNFYLTTWEEFHTGTLYLSYFSGPVEGIAIVCGLYAATAYFGPAFWHATVEQAVTYLVGKAVQWGGSASASAVTVLVHGVQALPEGVKRAEVMDVYLVSAGVGLLFNISASARNVLRVHRHQRRQQKLESKAGGTLTATPTQSIYAGVVPYTAFYSSLFLWVHLSPPQLITTPQLLLPLCLSIGFCGGLSVGRIITAHVTHQPFPGPNLLMAYPAVALAAQTIAGKVGGADPLAATTAVVWTGLGVSGSIYGLFVTDIVGEITAFLDIYCFSIKHKKATKVD